MDGTGYTTRKLNERADALRQRLQGDQERLERLRGRTDYAASPGIVGTREQALQRASVEGMQRMPAGEQIVRDPNLLKRAITPATVQAAPVSRKLYSPNVQPAPLKQVPRTLYANNLVTGQTVKKWPTSFKKAFHKPTQDEMITAGLKNLDTMSVSLLGRKRRY